VPRLGHDRLDDPPVSISRHLQQAADLLRRARVAEELLLALPDGRVLECESARAAEGGVQGGGEEARHGEVLRSFRVAGRFAARSDWQADLGDFEREVDQDVRTIALDNQGGAGADGEAGRPVGEQGGRQARRHKASAVNFPSMTRRYRERALASNHSKENLSKSDLSQRLSIGHILVRRQTPLRPHVRRLRLESGDVVVWSGRARFVYDGVAPLKDGEHPLTGRARINL